MKCKVCDSSNIELYLRGIYDDDNTSVYECKKCELQFLDPIMTKVEEAEYYDNYYQTQEDRYSNKASLETIKDNSYLYHKEHVDNYRKYFNNENLSVLEIGSGTGGFVKLLKEDLNIANITVVEKSNSNVDYLKANNTELLIHSNLEQVQGKFDVIIGIALFEHIRDPMNFLKKISHLLKDDGIVILEMPNKNEPLIDVYNIKEFKKFNYQKQHYYTYSEKNLSFLINSSGFKIESFYYAQVYSLDNHLSWLKYKKPRDYSDYTNIFSKETLLNYKKDLVSRKKADVIGVIFHKAKFLAGVGSGKIAF